MPSATSSGLRVSVVACEFEEDVIRADRINMETAVSVGQSMNHSPLHVPPSPVGAADYYCAKDDAQAASDFFEEVESGLDSQGFPLDPYKTMSVAMRDACLRWRVRAGKRGSMSRKDQGILYDLFVRTYLDYRAGNVK